MGFEHRRPAQTRVKHDILRQYIGAWMGIICGGLHRRRTDWGFSPTFDFVFLDGFAGAGSYPGDDDKEGGGRVFGSPVIGTRALSSGAAQERARGLAIRTTGIFIEENAEHYVDLVQALREADVAPAPRECVSIGSDVIGQNVAVRGDFRDHASSVAEILDDDVYLFAFVDPFGTSASMEALETLLERRKTDLIILFPSQRVLQDGGSASKAAEMRTETDWANVRRTDALFGTDEWQEIARTHPMLPAERIRLYTDLYARQLRGKPRKYWVKQIGLTFSASRSDYDGYSLFLVTEDADGAMRMNEILRSADYRKHWERWADLKERDRRRREATGGFELALDVVDSGPAVEEPVTPSQEEIAEALHEVVLPGEVVQWKELKGRLADTIYTEGEIRRTLTYLKNRGSWERPSDLRTSSEIHRIK